MVKGRGKLRSARCLTEVRDGGGVGLICLANTGAVNVLWVVQPAAPATKATLSVLGRYLSMCRTEGEGTTDCASENDIAI